MPDGANHPFRCELRFAGVASEAVLSAFPGLAAEHHDGATTLTGTVPDQAALYGLFTQTETLGLVLLEAHVVRA